jgi:tetratricopeptide (TPR) repeat protein
MKYCPSCHREFSDEVRQCQYDSSELVEETWQQVVAKSLAAESGAPSRPRTLASSPTFLPVQLIQPLAPKSVTSKRFRIWLVLFVVVGLILLPITIITYKSRFSLEGRLEAAIAKGNMFTPPGANAYELYQQLKLKAPSSSTLRKFDDQLFPLLTSQPSQLLTDFSQAGTKEPSLSEWQQVAKMLSWASEIRPDDKLIEAKALYCLGRISYVQEQKDAAFTAWTKAADLDPAWAIPMNGLGVVCNERKQYKNARPYFFEAIRRDPRWAIPHNNIGTSYYYERNYELAIFHYKQSIDRDSRWARPHAWLASIAMQQKQYETAVKEFERVLDPSATGTETLNLDKIRADLERARLLLSGEQ